MYLIWSNSSTAEVTATRANSRGARWHQAPGLARLQAIAFKSAILERNAPLDRPRSRLLDLRDPFHFIGATLCNSGLQQPYPAPGQMLLINSRHSVRRQYRPFFGGKFSR
jgi:hypothetical protein